MAIALVQVKGNAATTSVASIAVTVTATGAGNTLIVMCWSPHGTTTTITTSGGTGSDSFTQVYVANNSAMGTNADFWTYLCPSGGGGRTTITANFTPNAANGGSVFVYEVSGLANAALDQSFTGTGTTNPANPGPTGTLQQAAEFACQTGSSSGLMGSSAAGGWTFGVHLSGTGDSCAYQITAATTALTGNIAVSSGNWSSTITTFMVGPSAPTVVPQATGFRRQLGQAKRQTFVLNAILPPPAVVYPPSVGSTLPTMGVG